MRNYVIFKPEFELSNIFVNISTIKDQPFLPFFWIATVEGFITNSFEKTCKMHLRSRSLSISALTNAEQFIAGKLLSKRIALGNFVKGILKPSVIIDSI